MKIPILKISILTVTFLFISCKNNSQEEKQTTDVAQSSKIDVSIEVNKWKKELVDNKVLGTACNFESIGDKEAKEWILNNEGQYNGLPKNEDKIKTAFSDFDSDGKPDLLIYFRAQNCTGHNGGTPLLARIVYANGKTDDNLITNIKKAIISSYNEKMKLDPKLKQISDNYLDESVTIVYNNAFTGEFNLYTVTDAHCCPSYTGTFEYYLKNNTAEIEVLKN